MRTVVKLVVLVIVIALVRYNQQSKKDKKIEPFAVMENNGVVHSLYRELDLSEVTKALPSSSLDTLDVDTHLRKYVTAIVTVPIADAEPHHFQTTFKGSDGKMVVKNWWPVEGNSGPTATALFMIPDNIITGMTKVDAATTDSLE